MYYLVNEFNVPVNFADFGMAPIKAISTDKMNSCKYVLIAVTLNPTEDAINEELEFIASTSDPYVTKREAVKSVVLDILDTLKLRRAFQFYHPEFQAYCLMLDRKEVWTLQATIDYITDIQKSKQLSQYCQREAVAYTHELVTLYNKLNGMYNHRLPDFGSAELISFLEGEIRDSSNVDYRSAGKLMHYEKEHFYKFDKMSDFLNPDDVYTDKDNRIVWSTTKDRLGTHYIDCHLEDLLHECMAIHYLKTAGDYYYSVYDDVDATSSEEVIGDCTYSLMCDYVKRIDSLLNPLTDTEKIELASMINLHRDIFNEVCERLGVEFKLR